MVYIDSRAAPLRTHNGTPMAVKGQTAQQGYWPQAKPADSTLKYYWSTAANPYYGTENIYTNHKQQQQAATMPQQRRQYQPFPLTIPSGTPTPQPRGLPRQGSPPGAYQNVPRPAPGHRIDQQRGVQGPYGPKATTISVNGTIENAYAARATPARVYGNGNSNGQLKASGNRTAPAVVRTETAKNQGQTTVWSTQTDPAVTQIRRSTPPRFFQEKSRSVQNRSSKPPRWGRLMQSFCCCMAPQQEIEPVKTAKPMPVVGPQPPSPAPAPLPASAQSLITQVNKDGTTTVPTPSQAQQEPEMQTKVVNGTSNGYTVPTNLQTIIEPFKPAAEKLLLPPVRPQDAKKKCLIIDLDETLVHSSFKPVKNPDFVIPVEIDGVVHQVYVLKRPYVDEFLAHVGDKYECVLFTASLAKYADPVADLLDKRGVFRARLFREACVFHKGNYVKDLARLGRDLNKVLIMDNSPASYAFHPDNAIACQTWFDDPHDVELLDVLPLLDRLAAVDSVYSVLRQSESPEPRSDRSAS